MNTSIQTIDQYIASQPKEVASILEEVRKTIHKVIPEAEETIGYGIPTFKYYGNVVHFAGYKNHIGFYPGAVGVEAFADEIKPYNTSKGTIQFSLNEPIPYDLIAKITTFRVQQNLEKRKRNDNSTNDSTCFNRKSMGNVDTTRTHNTMEQCFR